MNPRIIAAISNVNMNMGHDGLAVLIRKLGIKLEQISGQDIVLFINSRRNRLKLLGANGVVVGYVKMPGEARLPLEAVQYVTRAFSKQGSINLDLAVKTYIQDRLARPAKPGSPHEVVRSGKAGE